MKIREQIEKRKEERNEKLIMMKLALLRMPSTKTGVIVHSLNEDMLTAEERSRYNNLVKKTKIYGGTVKATCGFMIVAFASTVDEEALKLVQKIDGIISIDYF